MHCTLKLVFIFVLLLSLILPTAALSSQDNVTLVVGGKNLNLSTPACLINDQVYVPLEALEAVGAKADPGKKRKDGQKVKVFPCKGDDFTARARLIGDHLMLPIQEMARELGAITDWNEIKKSLSICARIERVEFDGKELRVITSFPVVPSILDTNWTRSTGKVILDMKGALFPLAKSELSIDNSTNVQLSTGVQEDGNTARVVLDVPKGGKHSLTSPPGDTEIIVAVAVPETKPYTPATSNDTSQPNYQYPYNQPGYTPPPTAASITAVDYRKNGERSLDVYVSANRKSMFKTSLVRDPDRLTLDISNAALSREFSEILLGHGIAERVQIAQKDAKTVTLTVDLGRIVGFDAKWDDSGKRYVLSMEMPKEAGGLLSQKIIVIDPGHGGSQCGTTGCIKLPEKVHNLQIAKRVQRLLKQNGTCVLLTRDSDVDMELKERAAYALRHSADLFVSIHCNAMSPGNAGKAWGTETFFHGKDKSGKALAYSIQSEIVETAGTSNRGVKSDFDRYQTGFGVLRTSAEGGLTGVLIEVGFLDHPGDAAKITDPEFQEKVAEAIVRGLRAYVEGKSSPDMTAEKKPAKS